MQNERKPSPGRIRIKIRIRTINGTLCKGKKIQPPLLLAIEVTRAVLLFQLIMN